MRSTQTRRAAIQAVQTIAPATDHDILPFLLPPTLRPRRARRRRAQQEPSSDPSSSSSSSTSSSDPPRPRRVLDTNIDSTAHTPHVYPRGDIDPDTYLPDRYIRSDGHWVKSDCWRLHGRSSCEKSSSPANLETNGTTTVNTTATVTATSIVAVLPTATTAASPNASSSPTASTHDPATSISTAQSVVMSDLPRGWEKKPGRTAVYKIPVIVLGSITLAVLIVSAIWLLARMRHQRRKARRQDLERQLDKKKRRLTDDDSSIVVSEKDNDDLDSPRTPHSGKKFAGKLGATRLRWRGAGKRLLAKRRKASAVVPVEPSDTPSPPVSPVPVQEVAPQRPVSPPARAATPPQDAAPDSPTPETPAFPPAYDRPCAESQSEQHSPDSSPSHSPGNLPREEGHVATDDKATLARLAQLRSAPPSASSDTLSESGAASSSAPAAPEWEDLEDDERSPTPSQSPNPLNDSSCEVPASKETAYLGSTSRPHYSSERPPSWRATSSSSTPSSSHLALPAPPSVHESTSREYARLARNTNDDDGAVLRDILEGGPSLRRHSTVLPMYSQPRATPAPSSIGMSSRRAEKSRSILEQAGPTEPEPESNSGQLQGPSAPPMEEVDSHDDLEDKGVFASAPPLELDDEVESRAPNAPVIATAPSLE